MTKLKLGPLTDDKPVKLTIELPASTHRDLVAYAEVLAREGGKAVEPARLVAPMLTRFMATDRGFVSARRKVNTAPAEGTSAAPKRGSA